MMHSVSEELSNRMTLDEHVAHIQGALSRARSAIFGVAAAIRLARDELGDEIVNGDLAERLGMSKGTLSKWLKIASSDFILANQEAVPSTFTSLYNLTQLETQYHQAYDADADNRMMKLIEQGKITPASEIDEIKSLLDKIKTKLKEKSRKQREEALNSLSALGVQPHSNHQSLSDLISQGRRFKTFVVVLNKELVSRWGDEACLESDISEEFPLQELRGVSISEPIQLYVLATAGAIATALKIVSAFGFAFRGFYISALGTNGLALCKNNPIVVRGERGLAPQSKFSAEIASTDLADILEYAEQTGGVDRILVFSEAERNGWTVVN